MTLSQRRKKQRSKEKLFLEIMFDNRTVNLQEQLGISKQDIENEFFSVFFKHDNGQGYLSIYVVFRDIIKEELSPFGIMLFELLVQDVEKIEYQDLFYAIGSYSLFEVSTILANL